MLHSQQTRTLLVIIVTALCTGFMLYFSYLELITHYVSGDEFYGYFLTNAKSIPHLIDVIHRGADNGYVFPVLVWLTNQVFDDVIFIQRLWSFIPILISIGIWTYSLSAIHRKHSIIQFGILCVTVLSISLIHDVFVTGRCYGLLIMFSSLLYTNKFEKRLDYFVYIMLALLGLLTSPLFLLSIVVSVIMLHFRKVSLLRVLIFLMGPILLYWIVARVDFMLTAQQEFLFISAPIPILTTLKHTTNTIGKFIIPSEIGIIFIALLYIFHTNKYYSSFGKRLAKTWNKTLIVVATSGGVIVLASIFIPYNTILPPRYFVGLFPLIVPILSAFGLIYRRQILLCIILVGLSISSFKNRMPKKDKAMEAEMKRISQTDAQIYFIEDDTITYSEFRLLANFYPKYDTGNFHYLHNNHEPNRVKYNNFLASELKAPFLFDANTIDSLNTYIFTSRLTGKALKVWEYEGKRIYEYRKN